MPLVTSAQEPYAVSNTVSKLESPEATCEHEDVVRPESPYSDEAVERAAGLFRAAGDPARLRILERMMGREVCVSELAAVESEAMSTVSQRLRLLRADGLVSRRREGRHVYYSLADDHVAQLVKNALDHASEDER